MNEFLKRDEEILALHVAAGVRCRLCDTEDTNHPDCPHNFRTCVTCRTPYPCPTRALIAPKEAEEHDVRVVARAIATEHFQQTRGDDDFWNERDNWSVPSMVWMAMARAAIKVVKRDNEFVDWRRRYERAEEARKAVEKHQEKTAKAYASLLEAIQDPKIAVVKRKKFLADYLGLGDCDPEGGERMLAENSVDFTQWKAPTDE